MFNNTIEQSNKSIVNKMFDKSVLIQKAISSKKLDEYLLKRFPEQVCKKGIGKGFALLDYMNTFHRYIQGKGLNSSVVSYTSKLYITGDLAEENQFNFRRYSGYRSKINTNTEKRKSDIVDPETSKISNLRRRRNLRRIVNSNMSICKRPKFITLTFDRDVSVQEASHCFDVFMKRLRRRYKKLRYIWVKERTKHGRIHYHCIFFTDYFIPQKQLTALWGQGFTFIKLINNFQNVGAYMSKYITKDIRTEKNERFYSCSRGLLRPIIKISDYNKGFQLSGFTCYDVISYPINETLTSINKFYRRC